MDLEKVALEAVKVKINEVFSRVTVNALMEGSEIVIRIRIPDIKPAILAPSIFSKTPPLGQQFTTSNLDAEADAAARELLGGVSETETI